MLEVMHDVLRLVVGERCVVWVCREKSFASDDLSIVFVGVEVADV